jgi:hypothetical protein
LFSAIPSLDEASSLVQLARSSLVERQAPRLHTNDALIHKIKLSAWWSDWHCYL